MKRFLLSVVAAAILIAGIAEAKGPSSFGSKSSSSPSSSGSKSSSSGWGSKSSTPSKSESSSGWGSKSSSSGKGSSDSWFGSTKSQSATTTRPHISATPSIDTKAYEAAKSSGKAFTSKESALQDFKSKNATTYTNKFTSEPAARPTYIPTATNVGGKSVNIVYNSSHGGYGYIHPSLGTWIMYDTLSDMAMASHLMHNHGYYYGPPPMEGFNWFTLFVCACITAIVLLVLGAAINS